MSQPITINQEFICEHCHFSNTPASKTCRNHCSQCLYSKHVDLEVPGDRQSECHFLMEPIGLLTSGKKGWQIVHRCLKCQKQIINYSAEDDNSDQLIKLSLKQNLGYK